MARFIIALWLCILHTCFTIRLHKQKVKKIMATRHGGDKSNVTMSKASVAQSKSNRSVGGPLDFDDPFEWLAGKIDQMVTTFRTALNDDDAPMDIIQAAAQRVVASNRGGDVNEYARAIKLCSWLTAVPENQQPIQQPIPDNLDLGVKLFSKSKPGYVGRYEIAVESVVEGSVAQRLGIVPGMLPRMVRGQPTANVVRQANQGEMTVEEFDVALKGSGPPIVIWDPPDYPQRRVASIRKCMIGIAKVCRDDAVRPLEVTAVEVPLRGEDGCGNCHLFCADRPQSSYETFEGDSWSSLLEPHQTVDVRVPLEVKAIELPWGAPEGMEISGNVIQVDSADSRQNCLFTGMTLVEVDGHRVGEQPEDHLDGAWRYKSPGSVPWGDPESQYFVRRIKNEESGEYEYHFYEKFKSGKEIKGRLLETDMGRDGHWWLAPLNDGRQIRLRRDGLNMVSQIRRGESGSFASPVQAVLATPRERLVTAKDQLLNLKVRPPGLKDVKDVLVKSVRTSDSSYCRPGQVEVQLQVDDQDGAWRNAFSGGGAVPISFPALNTRNNLQCDAFIAESFEEVVDAAKDTASKELKWGALQVSISITAGVSAVIFPPLLGAHGAAYLGAGIGIKSVGTALKAGAHGAERVDNGGNFGASAFALELGVGVANNAISTVGGHYLGHALHHQLTLHGAAEETLADQVAEVGVEHVGEHAIEKIVGKHEEEDAPVAHGPAEVISPRCMEVLFDVH